MRNRDNTVGFKIFDKDRRIFADGYSLDEQRTCRVLIISRRSTLFPNKKYKCLIFLLKYNCYFLLLFETYIYTLLIILLIFF